jgi:hypothetical protein
MLAWSNLWTKLHLRYALVVVALVVVISSLLIEPLVVRVMGTPVQMAYQASFVVEGSDTYVTFPVTEVMYDDFSDDMKAIWDLGDFEQTREAFAKRTYYIVLSETNGVVEREAVVFERPDGLYLEATFDWFLWNETRMESSDRWQERYIGIQLNLPTLRQIYVPNGVPASVVRQLEAGTHLGSFFWYQGQLYWRSPNL